MNKDLQKELISKLEKLDLGKGFPYEEIGFIQEKYKDRIPGLQEKNLLIEDFNEYQMLVAGSASYILARRKIPRYQKRFLDKRFFEAYPSYKFLESNLEYYPNFKEEIEVFEKAREILTNF